MFYKTEKQNEIEDGSILFWNDQFILKYKKNVFQKM